MRCETAQLGRGGAAPGGEGGDLRTRRQAEHDGFVRLSVARRDDKH